MFSTGVPPSPVIPFPNLLFRHLVSFQKDARTPGRTRGALLEHCRNQRVHVSFLAHPCRCAAFAFIPVPVCISTSPTISITRRTTASIPPVLAFLASASLQRDCKPACGPCLPIRVQPERWAFYPGTDPTPYVALSTLGWARKGWRRFCFWASEEEVSSGRKEGRKEVRER